jgi:hypothetical protein
VVQKAQNYFQIDQQQKSTIQTENQPSITNHEKNTDFHEQFTSNAILDIRHFRKSPKIKTDGIFGVYGQQFSVY